MMKKIHLQAAIPNELAGKRLDQVLAQLFPDYSRSQLQEWIRKGWVTIDGDRWQRPRDLVKPYQYINIQAELIEKENWSAQPIPLNIIYEDDALLVINKPAGLVVHPGAGTPDETLVNALLHHAPTLARLPRAGLIHRLDKDTSGLLVVAKTLRAHYHLVKSMQAREISREYKAIVRGVMVAGGRIEAPIGRHPVHRTRMSVRPSGKLAITCYRIIEHFRSFTHIHIQLKTGRTHQIRVHLAHIHYPIVGDPAYGTHKAIPTKLSANLKEALLHFKRQALHAHRLTLTHPITSKPIAWQAPIPEDITTLIQLLKEDANEATLHHP